MTYDPVPTRIDWKGGYGGAFRKGGEAFKEGFTTSRCPYHITKRGLGGVTQRTYRRAWLDGWWHQHIQSKKRTADGKLPDKMLDEYWQIREGLDSVLALFALSEQSGVFTYSYQTGTEVVVPDAHQETLRRVTLLLKPFLADQIFSPEKAAEGCRILAAGRTDE